ncbi:hypothetical protein KCP75_14490 [Salmonella enterica subsp. enterica]|nr:hypothetical protein KCP75_14490 [Salmonella enterica subsp. enterica]
MSIFLIYGYEMSTPCLPDHLPRGMIPDECTDRRKANTDDLAQRHTEFSPLCPFGEVAAPAGVNVYGGYHKTISLHQVAQWPVQALEYKSFYV